MDSCVFCASLSAGRSQTWRPGGSPASVTVGGGWNGLSRGHVVCNINTMG